MENRKEFCLSSLTPLWGRERNGDLGRISGKKGGSSVQVAPVSLQAGIALPVRSPWAYLEAQGPLQTGVWANHLSSYLTEPTNAFPLGTSSQAWSVHKATLVPAGMAMQSALTWSRLELPGSQLSAPACRSQQASHKVCVSFYNSVQYPKHSNIYLTKNGALKSDGQSDMKKVTLSWPKSQRLHENWGMKQHGKENEKNIIQYENINQINTDINFSCSAYMNHWRR